MDNPSTSVDDLLTSSDVRLLSDIGFVAACSSQRERAVQIFQALTLFRPLRAFPYLGLAVANLNAKRSNEAILALALGRRVLGASPDRSTEAQEDFAMLGVFEGLAAHADGRRTEGLLLMNRAVTEAPVEGPAYRLGKRLLGLKEQEIGLSSGALNTLAEL